MALAQQVKRIQRGAGDSCQWNVRSPAVFGLGDAERTARINGLLKVRFPGANEEEMERKVTRCAPGGTIKSRAGTRWRPTPRVC